MKAQPFLHEVVWQLGPVGITAPVITTWGLIAVLAVLAAWLRRRLSVHSPGRVQLLAEMALDTLQAEMRSTMRADPAPFLPLIATLFIFILSANLCSLVPGLEPPTGALETDLALALAVFVAVLGWGVRRHGLWGYLKTYTEPNLLMLPLNLIEALTRVVSMTVRLFGNIMSGMFISAVVLGLAGLLVPVPFMALELLTGLIQAYIFTVLAMVFIAAAAGDHGD
ncbi:F0F1 ATP synthase subunit A [Curvibacter gracilis]|uniref:F0F1 ATP synthase subunit A n=1 Tax=Curvibacter gracilis TaxID=230310 RepID=UPI000484FA2A|nr:F0F1 ATP synthase subunit A [Curvibacter gracilis]